MDKIDQILKLKSQSGTHSPSIHTITKLIPDLEVKVDACFLSNPYATDLFLNYFNEDLIKNNKIRDVLEYYPSQNSYIAQGLASYLEVNFSNVFIGNGAIEIIQAVIHRFTRKKIVIIIPTFSSYYEFALDNVELVFYRLKKENNYVLDVDDYISFLKKHLPDTIIIINPNNPDGGYIDFNKIRLILNESAAIETVILDESFIHFAHEENETTYKTAVGLTAKYKNLIVIKSMSKDFGIAGIRAGFAIMDESRVYALLKNGYLWNSNGLSQYFFELYTSKLFLTEYDVIRKKYINEMKIFSDTLTLFEHLKVYPSKANFVLVEILDVCSSVEFMAELLVNYGVYVRDCADKIGLEGNFVRIASRRFLENEQIILAIREIIKKRSFKL